MSEQSTRIKERTPISPRTLVLAKQLGETKFPALQQLDRCVRVLGEAMVEEVLHETERIEQGEGLLTTDGQRRRTKGGVFLYLARGRCTPEQRAIVFPMTDWAARTSCTSQAHLFLSWSLNLENDTQRAADSVNRGRRLRSAPL